MQASDTLLDLSGARRRPRVVLVDDNEVFRTNLRELLEDYEIQVLGEGADGRDAVDLVERLSPDIVLMDLRMPGVDGIEAARTIKTRFPETQVILLTAYDDQALRADAAEASVSAYLIKGSRPESIHRAVVEAFESAPPRPSRPDPGTDEGDPLQRLAAAQIRLFSLRRRVTDPGQLDALDELGQAVEIGIGGLRELMFEIRPPLTQRSGLGQALRAQLLRGSEGRGLTLDLDDALERELPEDVWATAFDIGREAVENIRRHAAAGLVRLSLAEDEGGLLVELSDDGRGLSPRDLADSVGLSSMRDRAEASGGWCRIWSLPGAGTTVKFWLPL